MSGNDSTRENFWRAWAGPLAFMSSAAAMLVVALWAQSIDFSHMFRPVEAAVQGRWAEMYPKGVSGTSPTGWVFLSGVPTFALSFILGTAEAFTVANLLVLPALLFAFRYTVKALWPNISSEYAWLLAAISVWLPTTLAAYLNAYHPQDLAATALVVAGVGLLTKKHLVASGIAFAFAVMTRQWALLALLPAAGFLRGQTLKETTKNVVSFVSGGAVTALVLLLPVVLGGNEGWVKAFTSNNVAAVNDTILGRFQYQSAFPRGGSNETSNTLYMVGRVAPVVGAAALGAIAWFRRYRASELLIMFTLSGLALRMVFETANYLYYWVPFGVLFLLLVPYRKISWVAVGVFATAPWLLDSIHPPTGTTPGGAPMTDTVRMIRAGVTLLTAIAVPVACYFVYDKNVTSEKSQDLQKLQTRGTKNQEKRHDAGTNSRISNWRWGVATSFFLAVFAPYALGLFTPAPVDTVREKTQQQQQNREFLKEEGVDVSNKKVGSL